MELENIYHKFPTSESCIVYLEKLRWGGEPLCPYCNSTRHSLTKKSNRYHCNNCNSSYSVTVDTIFHKTRIDLQKWFLAIDLIFSTSQKITSRELALKIETTKDTAWRIIKEIKNAVLKQDSLIQKITDYDKK